MIKLKRTLKHIAFTLFFFVCAEAFASGMATIPEDSTTIGYGAFRNRKDLRFITIPYSVQSIDKNAFKNCPNLLSIVFDDEDNWYITQDEGNWQKKSMGTHIDVSDPSTNASAFRSGRYYFYKLESQ